MFVEQIPLAEKILRTVLIYAVVATLIRATGKRGLSALNNLDIVVMILLSNVVQNAIIGDDLTVTGGTVGAVTLVLVNSLLNRAAIRSAFFARIFDGTETQVISNGKVLEAPVRHLGMTRAELEHAVRIQNGEDIGDVETGVLAADGHLLVTLRAEEQSATKADVARLTAQLARIEAALGARGGVT
jgi:uncharacterized membrane protein YcaP (DUF421 family)